METLILQRATTMRAFCTLALLTLLAFSCQALKISDNCSSGATTSKQKKTSYLNEGESKSDNVRKSHSKPLKLSVMINVETYHGLGLAQGLMSPWLAGLYKYINHTNKSFKAI